MNILKAIFGGGTNNLNATDAKARIEGADAPFILDVRQPDEFRAGHIAGAKLIPLNELRNRMDELPKETDILCVCQSGSRSSAATSQLTAAGFQAINLRGGMMGWKMSGYPVKKGK